MCCSVWSHVSFAYPPVAVLVAREAEEEGDAVCWCKTQGRCTKDFFLTIEVGVRRKGVDRTRSGREAPRFALGLLHKHPPEQFGRAPRRAVGAEGFDDAA